MPRLSSLFLTELNRTECSIASCTQLMNKSWGSNLTVFFGRIVIVFDNT